MKHTLLISVASTALLLSACKKEEKPVAHYPVEGETVATVNNTVLTLPQLEAFVTYKAENGLQTFAPTDEFINMEILRQAAVNAGYAEKPEAQAAMGRAVAEALANLYVKDQVSSEVTDEEIKAEYDKQAQEALALSKGKTEYNPSHILVETEEEAKAIIASLSDKTDFAALAKEKSKDPSASQGGSLNWITTDKLVKEFGDALGALKAGEITRSPVQTQFGWHVIKLNETRPFEPQIPALDVVSDQFRTIILQKRMTNFMKELRDAADVVLPEAKETNENAPE